MVEAAGGCESSAELGGGGEGEREAVGEWEVGEGGWRCGGTAAQVAKREERDDE